ALSERFGKLPFADLLEPAIEIGERGYAVPIVVQEKWVAAAPLLEAEPGWAEAFLPKGRPPEVGERFAFAAAARSLKAIADTRGGMRLTPAQMLDDAYLAERAKLIDPKRAQRFSQGHAPRGGTIYLTAADERGMMVSFIQSNYMGFGSGVVVPGWGLSMQNRGHGFSLDPKSPNVVAPGKRPFHTIIPGFLTKDGRPQMSFGVMGGNMQPQGHLQTLVRMLVHDQQPQAACDAPRWRFNEGLEINVEAAM